ncbi:hypothetical protein AB9F29_13010 [Falsihalocynthiibacter sp. S25ZX9]|uniref:hypothetical protein n=1 Tax=Falsihalocynthiibacter sp. S25ZX9 TaxID=3240870 RepID=UPI00351060C8
MIRWLIGTRSATGGRFKTVQANAWANYVISLVERVSRITLILIIPSKRAKPAMGEIMKAIKDLPYVARKSITFDLGTEIVSWPHL